MSTKKQMNDGSCNNSGNYFQRTFKFSHRHNGSELFDSFELQEVVKQLNLALVKASAESSSPITSAVLNSPFYTKCFGGSYKQNAKASRTRRISYSQIGVENRADCRSAEINSIFLRLWNMAKQGFSRGKRNHSS
ncbi:hypothetical protein RDI58_016165 [Solanum bulbocastanum]|uniref:Uncharacterized protein n=1 Tax=Solanum bulbocastanum TaxID=147425 RepID=A0AAN8TGY1_SOLBU